MAECLRCCIFTTNHPMGYIFLNIFKNRSWSFLVIAVLRLLLKSQPTGPIWLSISKRFIRSYGNIKFCSLQPIDLHHAPQLNPSTEQFLTQKWTETYCCLLWNKYIFFANTFLFKTNLFNEILLHHIQFISTTVKANHRHWIDPLLPLLFYLP